MTIDLTDVLATRFALKTGASSTNVTMPAHGISCLDVESGAATLQVRVPQGTAARIRLKESVISMDVDTNRFPRLDSRLYQSPGFDTAADRVEIDIQSGLGSVKVI
jgi:hypothetical protein